MIRIDLKGDYDRFARTLDRAHRGQLQFVMARALTETARDAKKAVDASLDDRFDNPTPFTRKAIGTKAARKGDLTAEVFVKDQQAEYLTLQETGGTRTARTGSPIFRSVSQRVNQYGNLPRGAVGKLKGEGDTFVSDGRSPRVKHLKAGVYQRPKLKRATKGKAKGTVVNRRQPPRLLVAFDKAARYQPRFRFHETIEASVRSGFQQRLIQAMEQALATAR